MVRVQAGDLSAFEQLLERYRNMVFGLALSILGNNEDAEEASQDAFVKLYRARDQYDVGRDVEPWLLRIAGNACRDLLRRRRVARAPFVQEADGTEIARNLPDPRAEKPAERATNEQLIRHELAQLTERVRLPLELKYLRGMTNQQIADSLGISISNVKVRVARAKDILASRLEGVLET